MQSRIQHLRKHCVEAVEDDLRQAEPGECRCQRELLIAEVATGIQPHDPRSKHNREHCRGHEDQANQGDEPVCVAVAPVVVADSIDMSVAFRRGRWGQEEDYINCPFTRERYEAFWNALVSAERALPHDFEDSPSWFEGCLPVEVMASRGIDTLRFGPLRPVGLPLPGTGEEAWAVVQLRQDNREGTLFNLVGFQTSLRWGEQERVFRMIPGLGNAEFLRYGSMHRNTFIDSPAILDGMLGMRGRPGLLFAGQITGVEGYVESSACGILAGMFLSAMILGVCVSPPPAETATGSLLRHVTASPLRHFQPSNVNYGLFPPLAGRVQKRSRNEAYAERARAAFSEWLHSLPERLLTRRS